MPAVSVLVDNTLMARVRTEGLDVLSVNVGGAKIDEAFATVEFSGGKYPVDGESSHLVWLSEVALRPGQCVRVEVSHHGDATHAGKTLADLFPDSSDETEKVVNRHEVVDQLRLRPYLREHCSLAILSSGGDSQRVTVQESEHGFGASFLWNSTRPDRVSASLHTYSLDQLDSQEEFNYHFRRHLSAEEWIELTLGGVSQSKTS